MPPRRVWILRTLGLLLTAGVLSLDCLTIPRIPVTTDAESSWGAALGYAHEKGLQFGPQIAFTYGPLGFLAPAYFSPHAAAARMAADCVLCFAITFGLCLVAWRLNVLWRLLLLALFILVLSNIYPHVDLLINLGLVSWTLLCFAGTGRHLYGYLSGFIILAIAAAMIKVTFFCTATLCLLALVCDLALRGYGRLGLWTFLGSVAGLCVAWVAFGQNLINIGVFLHNSFTVSKGYHLAMPAEGPLSGSSLGLLVAIFGLAVAVIRAVAAFQDSQKSARWRGALLLAWVAALLFLNWKHAFVRADRCHVPGFLAFVPILVLALGILPCALSWARRLAHALAVICCLVSFTTLQADFLPGTLVASFHRPVSVLAANIRSVSNPVEYLRQMTAAFETEREAAQLPRLRRIIGTASVDVFGSELSYALFNDLNYTPRPVFQSYAACSRPLMQLNEQFFRSEHAPEYVLFRLGPIDHRFPPLEDALVLRHLLTNYELVEAEGPFLLLRDRSHVLPRLNLLREGTVHLGEKISLTDFKDADLWMEIFLEPTLRGRMADLFYHLSGVRLGVWSLPDQRRPGLFRAPPAMLAAGFLASPLIFTNENVVNIYGREPVDRPVAYSVEVHRDARALWSQFIHFRIYRIENPLGPPQANNP